MTCAPRSSQWPGRAGGLPGSGERDRLPEPRRPHHPPAAHGRTARRPSSDDVHNAPERLPVDAVVPFQVDAKQAKTLIESWINSRWFAPSEFKTYNRTCSPACKMAYFTYDAETDTEYTGERGVNRQVQVWAAATTPAGRHAPTGITCPATCTTASTTSPCSPTTTSTPSGSPSSNRGPPRRPSRAHRSSWPDTCAAPTTVAWTSACRTLGRDDGVRDHHHGAPTSAGISSSPPGPHPTGGR